MNTYIYCRFFLKKEFIGDIVCTPLSKEKLLNDKIKQLNIANLGDLEIVERKVKMY